MVHWQPDKKPQYFFCLRTDSTLSDWLNISGNNALPLHICRVLLPLGMLICKHFVSWYENFYSRNSTRTRWPMTDLNTHRGDDVCCRRCCKRPRHYVALMSVCRLALDAALRAPEMYRSWNFESASVHGFWPRICICFCNRTVLLDWLSAVA